MLQGACPPDSLQILLCMCHSGWRKECRSMLELSCYCYCRCRCHCSRLLLLLQLLLQQHAVSAEIQTKG